MIEIHCRHDILIPFAPRETTIDDKEYVVVQEHVVEDVGGVGKVSIVGRVRANCQVLAVVGRIFRSAESIPPLLLIPPDDFVWARVEGQSYYFDATFPPDDCRLAEAVLGGDNFIATWVLFKTVPYWIRVNCERQFYGVQVTA